MRGKRIDTVKEVFSAWNIPAYAGKTPRNCGDQGERWEHPRVCGENVPFLYRVVINVGTSPRMRGKHPGQGGFFVSPGNIPAYAGKTIP